MISKVRFEAIACAFVLVPSDSDEQSRLRSALTLIFKLLAPMIFERCGTSAVAELVRGPCSNQEPLSLSARILFFSWRNGALTFFFGPLFLFILAQGLFSALIFRWTQSERTALLRENFFKCAMYTKYANNMKLLRELLPGDSLSYEIMTLS